MNPKGTPKAFATGQGQYHGPPLVMLLKEEYDLLVAVAEQAEHYIDERHPVETQGNALVVRLSALADFRKRTTSAQPPKK